MISISRLTPLGRVMVTACSAVPVAKLVSGAASDRTALRLHDIQMSLLEGRLARGDRRLADVVEHAYRGGARFDGWDEGFFSPLPAQGEELPIWIGATADPMHESEDMPTDLPTRG